MLINLISLFPTVYIYKHITSYSVNGYNYNFSVKTMLKKVNKIFRRAK